MAKTLFERIAAGEVPAQIVYQDDKVFAFRDIKAGAPTHVGVEIGERRRISSSAAVVAHQAIDGVGGAPGRTRMEMTWLFVTPPGHTEPTVVEEAESVEY